MMKRKSESLNRSSEKVKKLKKKHHQDEAVSEKLQRIYHKKQDNGGVTPACLSTASSQGQNINKEKTESPDDNDPHTKDDVKKKAKKKKQSCMKHKHKDKVQERVKEHKQKKSKKNKKKSETIEEKDTVMDKHDVETSIKLPKSVDDASSNWNQLQKILQLQNPSKKFHRKQPPSKFSRKKTEKPDASKKKKEKAAAPAEIWFDDVDEVLVDSSRTKIVADADGSARHWNIGNNPLVKPESYQGLTKHVAMDCEMVGVGPDGSDSLLARVSIVNQYGKGIYDKYVTPTEPVTDYRTQYSGIRPQDLENAEDFILVQKEVSNLITGRILVGHAIHNDLKVLFLDHPRKKIRDTSRYRPFRALSNGATPSLKKLSQLVLGVKVQTDEHNSVQDAQAAMRLYTMYRQKWESELNKRKKFKKKDQT